MLRTLRVVLVLALGGLPLLVVFAGGTAFAKPVPPVSLTYERADNAADCPDAVTLKDAVRARLGFDPFREPAAISIRASVSRAGDELRAAILASDGTTQTGERHLVSSRSDCGELASAMALALSIAIDPLGAARERQPAPQSIAATTSRTPVLAAAPPPTPTAPMIIHASLGTVGNVGGSLSPALGFVAGAGLGTKAWTVAIEGGADLPSSRAVQGGSISVSTLSGTLAPCLHRWVLGACALARVAVMRGSAQDLVNPRQVSTPFVALGARTLIELPADAAVSFRAHLDLLSPLVRTTLRVGGDPGLDVASDLGGPGYFRGREVQMIVPSGSSQSVDVGPDPSAEEPRSPGFSAVYRAQFGFVVKSLRRLGIPPGDLEDLTHDVFITAYRRRADYDAQRPIKPWLFGIAFRMASDWKRLVRHARELPLDRAVEAPDSTRPPDEAAALSQDRRLVLDALARVDLDRRAVFIMHDIEGLPIPQVSDALQIPSGTAYSRLRQARIEFADAVRSLRQGGAA